MHVITHNSVTSGCEFPVTVACLSTVATERVFGAGQVASDAEETGRTFAKTELTITSAARTLLQAVLVAILSKQTRRTSVFAPLPLNTGRTRA